jgi:transposase
VNRFGVDGMKTASKEIRETVVKAYMSGTASRKQLAEIFGYHIQSIGNWIRRYAATKQFTPLPKGHRKSVFTDEEKAALVELLKNPVDVTLAEIKVHFNKSCSLTAIYKLVKGLGFIYKKNTQGQRARTRRHPSGSPGMENLSKKQEPGEAHLS